MITANNGSTPLAGIKLVVTAYDLEQAEHRGIAVYSKSLIKALKQAGATIWLLSEFTTQRREQGTNKLSNATQKLIRSSVVLNALATGKRPESLPSQLQRILTRLKLDYAWEIWLNARSRLSRRKRYRSSDLLQIDIRSLYDNPYLRVERLDYLQWVDGILIANGIYRRSHIMALGSHSIPVSIDLKGFDGLVTTCPENLRPLNAPIFVQTVHDIIPLEYSLVTDSKVGFYRRLEASRNARKIFVSRSTAVKFDRAVPSSSQDAGGQILIQPPSLHFDQSLTTALSGEIEIRTRTGGYERLRARRFFLFNSSIEPRKNVQFLLKAFKASGLGAKGWNLCITGKSKNDEYSRQTIEMASTIPSVVLTDYIDELTKQNLYLMTECLLSPSLVEGFGIPVLDAACLGVKTLASPSDSHVEISSLYDFNHLVQLKDTLKVKTWATAMQEIARSQSADATPISQTVEGRLERYALFQQRMSEAFRHQLVELIKESRSPLR